MTKTGNDSLRHEIANSVQHILLVIEPCKLERFQRLANIRASRLHSGLSTNTYQRSHQKVMSKLEQALPFTIPDGFICVHKLQENCGSVAQTRY